MELNTLWKWTLDRRRFSTQGLLLSRDLHNPEKLVRPQFDSPKKKTTHPNLFQLTRSLWTSKLLLTLISSLFFVLTSSVCSWSSSSPIIVVAFLVRPL